MMGIADLPKTAINARGLRRVTRLFSRNTSESHMKSPAGMDLSPPASRFLLRQHGVFRRPHRLSAPYEYSRQVCSCSVYCLQVCIVFRCVLPSGVYCLQVFALGSTAV